VSHTQPYRYFDNKEALLARVRTEAVLRLQDYVVAREPQTPRSLIRIKGLVQAFVEFVRRHPADYLLIFATHQPAPTDYPELLAARQHLFDHCVSAAAEGIARGELHGRPLELAHAVWVSLHGLMMLHVANQLVHGCGVDELVDTVMERVLRPGPLAARAPAPQIPAAARSPRTAAPRSRRPARKPRP
jgi:AcrR family transcriptional regulator